MKGSHALIYLGTVVFLLAADQATGCCLDTENNGAATVLIPIPNVATLVGSTFYFQAFVYNGTPGRFSNAVTTRICP